MIFFILLSPKRNFEPHEFVRLKEILANIPGRQVLTHHQCHLEHDRMVKLAQVQTGQLFDLLQAVHQSITVHKQLTGSFRNVQIVLKELINGEEGLLIQRIDGILLEHLRQEDIAQGSGQLIDQTADTQIFIIDDALFGIENLAYLDGKRWTPSNKKSMK